eukprot:124005_1
MTAVFVVAINILFGITSSNVDYIFVAIDEYSLPDEGIHPSWWHANKYCKITYGTSLASYGHISDLEELLNCIPNDDRIFIGLQKYSWSYDDLHYNSSIDKAHWIFTDGRICPSQATDTYGYRLCVDDWHPNEPNHMFRSEHCAEMLSIGKINDIICDHVPYSWAAGFICAKPNNYNGSSNVAEYCQKMQDEKQPILSLDTSQPNVEYSVFLLCTTLMLMCSVTGNILLYGQRNKKLEREDTLSNNETFTEEDTLSFSCTHKTG